MEREANAILALAADNSCILGRYFVILAYQIHVYILLFFQKVGKIIQ
ncbi:unnamed protein product [Psylliodes chrysocephalus]|uniref:Uncharacterized protein n=1 Tax=Psylliodes chrysocephalus TaxID=3402493 RepID=A0A9P0D5H8_9CUCU|nr:unnamed protein product [Psylliodes chrysocephala]